MGHMGRMGPQHPMRRVASSESRQEPPIKHLPRIAAHV